MIFEAALWGAAASVSLVVGALVQMWFPLRPRLIGLTLGLGAGALIAAVSFELVEEAIDVAGDSGWPIFGMAAGALTFFGGNMALERRGGSRKHAARREGDEPEGSGAAIALGTVLDGIPESLVIGLSVATGNTSVAMVAAAFLSNMPEAIGASDGLERGGMRRRRILTLWIALVAMSALAAAIGAALGDSAPEELAAFFQTFAAGAMLTMLTNTMIPEAYRQGGTLTGLILVVGFTLAAGISAVE